MRVIAPLRMDDQGSGRYQSPRGSRKHKGVDWAAAPGSAVLASEWGCVTKLGYPYADDLSFRYVEVTDGMKRRWRYFYVQPSVEMGERVCPEDTIGTVQDIRTRYPGMTPHVHIEILEQDGTPIDPTELSSG